MREYLKITQQIKNIESVEEMKKIMKGKVVPGTENSMFEDEIYIIKVDSKLYNVKVKLNNNFLDTILRLICFFKLGGKLAIKPIRRGKSEYIYKLINALRELELLLPKINSFNSFKSITLDELIENLNNHKSSYTEKNKYDKIRVLFEWAKYASRYVETLFSIDVNVFFLSKEYEQLVAKYFKIRGEEVNLLKRVPFELELTRVIMYNCIKYIEEYSEDGILATKYYITSLNEVDTNKKYRKAFYEIRECTSIVNEPQFISLINDCKKHKTPNEIQTNLVNVKGLRQGLEDISKKLEAACIIVILITTGMRQSELFALPRRPKIMYDETLNLERIIFKTSLTEDGESIDLPIPIITKKAIDILSSISTLKDGSNIGRLLNGSLYSNNHKLPAKNERIYSLIDFFCESLNLKETPTPHQFRHIIAYLISYDNKKDGLELARMLLGHKSITMTLHYLGHYNINFKEQVVEISKEDSKIHIKDITLKIKKGERFYAPRGKSISEEVANYDFSGEMIEEFADLFEVTMNERIDRGEVAIIQTPVCLCIHDLTKPDEMACQRGFNIRNFISERPKPAYCQAYNCSNAFFTEVNVEDLQVGVIDDSLKKRLEENRFFMDNGGFDNDPYRKLKNEYFNKKDCK